MSPVRVQRKRTNMDPRVISHFIGGTWSAITGDWITARWSWECTACPDGIDRVCAYVPVDEARDHLRDVHGIKDWLPATLITDAHGRRVGRYCRCHGRGCHSCWVLTCPACGGAIPPKTRTGCCPSCGVRATGDYMTPVVVDAPVFEVSYAR